MPSDNPQALLAGIRDLEQRNKDFLHLTINENQMSNTANAWLQTKLGERYYFGGGRDGVVDFTSFTFVGFPELEKLVHRAEEVLRVTTGGAVVNLNCLSGIHAMMCAILSTTNPGDVVMTLSPDHGGHMITKTLVERLGRGHVYATFGLDRLEFNAAETARQFRQAGAKVLYVDISNYLNPVNISALRHALGEEPLIIYDASHSLGLILGREFQDPLREGANVICGNTHKTLAGPHRGLIVFRDHDLGRRANEIISQYLYSSVQVNHLISLAITILEYEKFGKAYARQVIANSRALGAGLEELGFEVRHANNGLVSNNEQVHLFIDTLGPYADLYKRLVANNISTNFLHSLGGRYYARLGTQELTRRGLVEADMSIIAKFLERAFKGETIKSEVIAFTRKFSSIKYSFDL